MHLHFLIGALSVSEKIKGTKNSACRYRGGKGDSGTGMRKLPIHPCLWELNL